MGTTCCSENNIVADQVLKSNDPQQSSQAGTELRQHQDTAGVVANLKARLPPFFHSSEKRGLKKGELRMGHGIYRGDISGDSPQGNGQIFFQNGRYFQGLFDEGVANGTGRLYFAEGFYYEGMVKDNVAQGTGKIEHLDKGYRYEGQWRNNKPDGAGKEVLDKHYQCSTTYREGVRHGPAVVQFEGGEYFEGQFKNGVVDGEGKFVSQDYEYEGGYKDGLCEGRGVLRSHSGGYEYEGHFRKGRFDGEGELRQGSKTFRGEWREGVREGVGRLRVGVQQFVGRWQNGRAVFVQQS